MRYPGRDPREIDNMMSTTTTDNQVTIKKTISTISQGVTFSYQTNSRQSSVGRLRSVEQLPEPTESTAVRFDGHDQGRWEYETTRTVVFRCEQLPSEPVEVTFHAQSDTLSPRECVSKLTTTAESAVDRSTCSKTHPTSSATATNCE
jgi:hypothetical protein